jgi:hypothetical protein
MNDEYTFHTQLTTEIVFTAHLGSQKKPEGALIALTFADVIRILMTVGGKNVTKYALRAK